MSPLPNLLLFTIVNSHNLSKESQEKLAIYVVYIKKNLKPVAKQSETILELLLH